MSEQPTPSAESLQAKHETSDVHSKPLMLSALGLAAAVALVCLFLIWFFDRLEGWAHRRDPQLSPLVGSQVAPPPRLQENPAGDLKRMRAAEDQALYSYRWIDKERGVVQLPVERAMELLLEEGLPKTKAEVPRAETSDEKEATR
ncbi:MAG TPA: hypothetical protein PK867_30805 [Pirellulales bacterium]|nr:hypothetical protein [Pirellulales bacterium]